MPSQRPDLLPHTTVRLPPLTEEAELATYLPPAPALRLSVAEVRLLLCALLPLPRRDL